MLSTDALDRRFITDRWLEYEGELRAGLLRVALITCFYAVELFQYMTAASVDEAGQLFHRQATYLSAAWLLISLAALVAIARQWLPAGLKYFACGVDIVLLTAVAWNGSGAGSPLASLYLLLVVMSGLRGSLNLIWFSTLMALAAYFVLLYMPRSGATGSGVPGSDMTAPQTIKPIVVMIMGLGIAATGVVTGQLVRMLRQIVSEVCLRSADDPLTTIQDGSVKAGAVNKSTFNEVQA